MCVVPTRRGKKGHMRILISLIIMVSFIVITSDSCAEYIRSTNEDELIMVSSESEVRMGKSLAKSVEKKFGLDDDATLQEKIDKMGQRIAVVCDRRDITYHFKVLEGKELDPERRINAFALPGGYVYIFRDMIELMENDDEIAGILAHEVGHIAAKHSVKKLQGSYATLALILLSGTVPTDRETMAKTNAAVGLLMTSYSREDEAIADKLSVKYMKAAGYDPKAVISSFDKMIELQQKAPIKRYTAYRSHPYYAERKALAKKEIYGSMEFVDFINEPTTLGEK